MKRLYILMTLLLPATVVTAQEINFSRIQDMAMWYNQSLKTDKYNSVKLNMRNVRYDGLMAYKSLSAMADIALVSREAREELGSGYLSISAGAASDRSNEGILVNTLGLIGMSYAVPVGTNGIYLGLGVQGNYFQSRLNAGSEGMFGDQYDQYGPIGGQTSNDRLAAGWAFRHLNLNAGLSVFGNTPNNKWYLGASVMNINRPYTDQIKSDLYRLHHALSVQGGYKYITDQNDNCAFYMTMNWQGKAIKHFYNVSFSKAIPEANAGVGLGLGYRYEDALVPNVEFRYAMAIISLGYDINISAFNPTGFKRNGVELALKFDF